MEIKTGDEYDSRKSIQCYCGDIGDRRSCGITISYQAFQGEVIGNFQPQRNTIQLATWENKTFFHELAHAAHSKFTRLKNGQHWHQEVVAELTAAVLGKLYDQQPNTGYSYCYIERYAKDAGLDVYKACLFVLADTERCLKLILEEATGVLVTS